jgi:hypothetical protein
MSELFGLSFFIRMMSVSQTRQNGTWKADMILGSASNMGKRNGCFFMLFDGCVLAISTFVKRR